MISDVLGFLGATLWARVGLVFFLLLFAGIVIWTYRGGPDRFRHESHLPLDEGSSESSTETRKELP
jgi:hypothetical protein